MKIACIGWGSLIWDKTRNFDIDSEWYLDGPMLPIEFLRQSQNGRITLVLYEGVKLVPSLWAVIKSNTLSDAVEKLRVREGTAKRHIHKLTANDQPNTQIQRRIQEWLQSKDLDAVIWTGLPPKFKDEDNRIVSMDELVEYFDSLSETELIPIKEYIQNAPSQIETDYRFQLEEYLTPEKET